MEKLITKLLNQMNFFGQRNVVIGGLTHKKPNVPLVCDPSSWTFDAYIL